MSTVSEQLRQAREAQKLTVHQVAEIIKIRTDHLRALEAGNFEVFSAPVYIRGFVRGYATLLKLDVPGVMTALEAELKGTDKFSEPPPLTDSPRGPLDFVMLQLSKLNKNNVQFAVGTVVFLAVVVVIFFVVRHTRKSDPLADLKPGVYQPAQTNSGDTLPLPARR